MKPARYILVTIYSNITPVGIPTRRLSAINNNFFERFNRYGYIPLLITAHMSKPVRDELYNLSRGVLFTGGHDWQPSTYGQHPHKTTHSHDALRDVLELDILKQTLNDGKPFLGICRGAQALAIACGGSLVQHLPDVTKERHGYSDEETTDDPDKQLYHDVQLVTGTKIHAILQKETVSVVTRHRQAIDNPGNLVVSGRSPAGIIEAVEHPTLPFHIGVQSHPEYGYAQDELFEAFAKAADQFRKPTPRWHPIVSRFPFSKIAKQ